MAKHQARERIEPTFSRSERRAGAIVGGGWGAFLGSGAGTSPVTLGTAESLSAVIACVELIAGAVASLPATIVQDTPDGPMPAPDTLPAWRLLSRPSPAMSWPAWASMTVASILLQGNGLSAIATDGRGAVSSLTAVPWGWVAPQVLQSGRLVFDVMSAATAEARFLGLPPRLLASECVHIKARSDHGIIGRSVLSRAAGVVREGLALGQVASASWRNAARPSGYLSAERVLDSGQRERAETLIDNFTGAVNTGRVPLLEDNWQYHQVAFNSVDAEFLASRVWQVGEIARLFNVPEPMLQTGQRAVSDLAPFVTVLAQFALAPLVAAIEAEFDFAVLPAGFHLSIDLSAMLRGAFSAQVAAACAAVQSRILTPNDARRMLGFPAHSDGDALGAGPAPSYPADGTGMPHLGPSPGPGGDLPEPGTNGNAGAG